MPKGNIYMHELFAILAVGAAGALGVVGSVNLAQPGVIDGIRRQINDALAPFDVQI